MTSPEVATAIVAAAAVGAGMAAATGGDVLKGALSGAIGGMFGVGGDLVMAVAGGAVGALVTGGDPLMGALSAGISAGVGACFAKTPLPGVLGRAVKGIGNAHLRNLMFSAASGALCGGVTAEIFGGDFTSGALYGAIGAAATFVVTAAIIRLTSPRGTARSPYFWEHLADPKDVDVAKVAEELLYEAAYQADIKEMNDFASRFLNELYGNYGDRRNEYASFAVKSEDGYKIEIRHPLYKKLRAFEGEFANIPRSLMDMRMPQDAVMMFHTHGTGKGFFYQAEQFSGRLGSIRMGGDMN